MGGCVLSNTPSNPSLRSRFGLLFTGAIKKKPLEIPRGLWRWTSDRVLAGFYLSCAGAFFALADFKLDCLIFLQ